MTPICSAKRAMSSVICASIRRSLFAAWEKAMEEQEQYEQAAGEE